MKKFFITARLWQQHISKNMARKSQKRKAS